MEEWAGSAGTGLRCVRQGSADERGDFGRESEVVVAKTRTGKTGLVTVMVEEALRARVSVLTIDVKGEGRDAQERRASNDPRDAQVGPSPPARRLTHFRSQTRRIGESCAGGVDRCPRSRNAAV